MTTNREIAEVARKAAEIIQEKGKATGMMEDELGRVCAIEALRLSTQLVPIRVAVFDRLSNLVPCCVPHWSDDWNTTEEIIAKTFLQVADEIEVSDD